MIRVFLTFLSVVLLSTTVTAQVPKNNEQQELEKERQRLKKELEQTQQLLDKTKKSTKENLGQLALINRKLNLQENVINNISRDINLLDNNITKSQRDVRKLSLLLDTLKQEYAKSMIYSYKNRSNSDFLNFLFSASSFNDAIKRITYLKSYRNYREMQGENILRTQGLLKDRIGELSGNKQKKSVVLETQSKEIVVLAEQQKEKNDVVSKLKAQSKELNNQIAAKKKQMQKVSNALAAAIKKAREEAIAEAKAQAEKLQRENAAKEKAAAATKPTGTATKPVTKPAKTTTAPAKPQNVLLPTAADVKLNANFISNRGSLPWPVDKGYVIMHYGLNELPNGVKVDNPGVTIGGDVGASVKAVFDGEVVAVNNIEDMQMIVLKHGGYFSAYSNLSGVSVSKGQTVHTGQQIGRIAVNDEGVGSIDLIISSDKSNFNPESWLKRR